MKKLLLALSAVIALSPTANASSLNDFVTVYEEDGYSVDVQKGSQSDTILTVLRNEDGTEDFSVMVVQCQGNSNDWVANGPSYMTEEIYQDYADAHCADRAFPHTN